MTSSSPPSATCWPARLLPASHLNSSSVSCHYPCARWVLTGRHPPCPVCPEVRRQTQWWPPQSNERQTWKCIYIHSSPRLLVVSRCASFHVCHTRACETGWTWPSVPRNLGGKEQDRMNGGKEFSATQQVRPLPNNSGGLMELKCVRSETWTHRGPFHDMMSPHLYLDTTDEPCQRSTKQNSGLNLFCYYIVF